VTYTREKRPQTIQILDLANGYFKVEIITILKDVKEDIFIMNK
jgi:hypothetical protein